MSQGQYPPNAQPPQQGMPADLPQHARERIADMRARKFFTSDLSVNEFLLVKQAGFDPLGLVMGSSIYQIAPRIPNVPSGQPGCEVVEVTRALYHARELAMNRMEEEAEQLGADGIVGVRLHVNLSATQGASPWGAPRTFTREERIALQRWYWNQATQRGWGQQPMTWQQQQQFWANPMNLPPWLRPKTPPRAAYAFGQNIAEFLAIGTAVRHREPAKIGVTVTEKNHAWRRWNTNIQAAAQPSAFQKTPQQIGNAALNTGELLELFVIGTAVVPMDTREPAPSPTLVMTANDAPVVASEGGEE
jgi:uncharacterized protein YbjQ (UPF0145 family)